MDTIPTIPTDITPADDTTIVPSGETIEDVTLPSEEIEDPDAKLSPEELLAAYKALKNKSAEQTEASTQISVDDLAKMYKEKNGVFTEDDYTELASKGISKDFIDTYVEGARVAETKRLESLIGSVGTVEDYTAALVYAAEHWDAEQIATFNDIVSKGADDATFKMVASVLIKDYKMSLAGNTAGTENGLITETKAPKNTVKGYESKADMVKDMSDKRYATDPAYRKKVEEKMSYTDIKSLM